MSDDWGQSPATITVHEPRPIKLYDAHGRAIRVRQPIGFAHPEKPVDTPHPPALESGGRRQER